MSGNERVFQKMPLQPLIAPLQPRPQKMRQLLTAMAQIRSCGTFAATQLQRTLTQLRAVPHSATDRRHPPCPPYRSAAAAFSYENIPQECGARAAQFPNVPPTPVAAPSPDAPPCAPRCGPPTARSPARDRCPRGTAWGLQRWQWRGPCRG